MNKIQAVSVALLALSAASLAHAGSTTGGNLTAAATMNIDSTTCAGLKEAVKVQLSAANAGVVDCPSASAAGVGVANAKGKGRSYGASSSGGAITEGTFTPSDLGAASTAAGTAATTASAAASSS